MLWTVDGHDAQTCVRDTSLGIEVSCWRSWNKQSLVLPCETIPGPLCRETVNDARFSEILQVTVRPPKIVYASTIFNR
jgi:hypothetical protein